MLLDLEDVQIRASIRRVASDRIRLVLEYPREDHYRDRVLAALADLLRPSLPATNQPNEAEDAQR